MPAQGRLALGVAGGRVGWLRQAMTERAKQLWEKANSESEEEAGSKVVSPPSDRGSGFPRPSPEKVAWLFTHRLFLGPN